MLDRPLILLGCGKMGSAMLEGWMEIGLEKEQIYIIEPHQPTVDALRENDLKTFNSLGELPPDLEPEIVIFAVKPQTMDEAAPAYSRYCSANTTFLSIAAGKTIRYFEDILGTDAIIVRAMPNTPASIRRGITVAIGNARVSNTQQETCRKLLEAVGEVLWVENEELIDIVTALSGGGPAYVFLLTECMAQAGIDAGLPADLSNQLARVTVSGAGELMHKSNEKPAILRQNVTSRGGTTAEALKILMAENGFQSLMTEAIAAATARSKELAY